jgi:hypothetical protein
VQVSVSAVTDSGNAVNESFGYHGSEGLHPFMHGGFLGEYAAKGIPYSRILTNCKFSDMLRPLTPLETMHTATQLPAFCVNMDNFARVDPLPPPNDENV